MKIAIVVNSFPEYSETFIINKVIFLAKAGHDVSVVSLNGRGNRNLYKLYKFKNMPRVQIVHVKLPKSVPGLLGYFFKKPISTVTSLTTKKRRLFENLRKKALLNIFNNNGFDIVHFEYSGIAAALISVLPDIQPKTVVSCRGSAEKVKPLTEPHRVEKLKQVFTFIKGIHCVSEDMKQTIAPYCPDISRAFVNRPAIDASFFEPKEKPVNEVLQILTIGRFTFQKGYLLGLMAMKQLADKGYRFVWNIIGEGPQEEELIFHIHTLGLTEHVKLLGKKNKNEVNDLLAASDVFFLSSVYEGIPNVVLEAMAMELPVVTSKCGGVDEVIEHGKDGLIAELYDVDGLTTQLETLLKNRQLRMDIGKEARQKILAEYTLQRQVKVFEEAYRHIVHKRRRSTK